MVREILRTEWEWVRDGGRIAIVRGERHAAHDTHEATPNAIAVIG